MNNKKKRIFDIIQIGYAGDVASRTFDIAITAAIIINLFIAIFDTFEQSIPYQPVLDVIGLQLSALQLNTYCVYGQQNICILINVQVLRE